SQAGSRHQAGHQSQRKDTHMNSAPDGRPSQVIAEDSSRQANEPSNTSETATWWLWQPQLIAGILMGLLPAVSFLCQYVLSLRSGTQQFFSHHLTVMVVDWLFVPFNFFVVRIIEWRRG